MSRVRLRPGQGRRRDPAATHALRSAPDWRITHTVRHDGQVVVIDHVPAEVCSVCGDVLLRPETVRRIEELLAAKTRPTRQAPVYEYA